MVRLAKARLRKDGPCPYIGVMNRILALLLLLAGPALAQGSVPDAAGASDSGVVPDAADIPDEGEPADPVSVWEAEPTTILAAEGVDLEAFEYLARPLVIFGDSPRQPQVLEQLRLLEADARSLMLREVAIVIDTDPDARSLVRQTLRPRGFGVVLVDKDGRVTLRRPAPLSVREIARAIDRTPIRQEELRNDRGAEPIE